MITPFGAIFEPNVPSPMETYAYFKDQKNQDTALAIQKKLAAAKAEKDADEAYQKEIKPLTDFKTNTGYTNPEPDALVNQKIKDIQAAAEKMYRTEGKSVSDVGLFINNSLRDVNSTHNWYKNAREALDKQLETIKEKDGVDVNKIRELGTLELLYVDDGKGGKRLRTANEMEDVSGILPKILSKHADKLTVKNEATLFNMPDDGVYDQEHTKLKTADGRIVKGTASAVFNKLYQDVIKTDDNDVKIITKAIPAEKNGNPVLNSKGRPVMVLPPEAYIDFISNPGRMVKVEQLTKKKMEEENKKMEIDALSAANDQLALRYGMSLKSIPAAKRLKMAKDLAGQLLSIQDKPDEEVVRQQAAFELADTYIAKKGVKVNPDKIPIRVSVGGSGGGSTKPTEETVFVNAYKELEDGLGPNGKGALSDFENAVAPILDYVRKVAGKKPSKLIGQAPQEFDVFDINVYSKDGGLYAEVGGKTIKLPKYAINRGANPGSAKVVTAITKDAQGKGSNSQASGKTMTKDQYRKLTITERQAFINGGGKVQ